MLLVYGLIDASVSLFCVQECAVLIGGATGNFFPTILPSSCVSETFSVFHIISEDLRHITCIAILPCLFRAMSYMCLTFYSLYTVLCVHEV